MASYGLAAGQQRAFVDSPSAVGETAARDATHLEREKVYLEAIAKRLIGINDVAGAILARAFGPMPEGTEKTPPRAVPQGVIGELLERHEGIAALLMSIDEKLNRLCEIV